MCVSSVFFVIKQQTAYDVCISDWSSDVCSSDLGDAARVAGVGLHRGRVEHVTGQHQGRIGGERVEEGGVRIGQQHHVGLVDAAPAGDAGTVEHLAVLEQRGFDDRLGEGDVVLRSEEHTSEIQSLMRISYAVVCL